MTVVASKVACGSQPLTFLVGKIIHLIESLISSFSWRFAWTPHHTPVPVHTHTHAHARTQRLTGPHVCYGVLLPEAHVPSS